ncbi:hypothetical protein [Asticcacaulis excentricus]|uniref:Lectin-like protein BA14k n=1 Tax=Asticcacaulis excentricus TaxID=78587 RepID=A0A3G9G2Z1_9CAUL|nr:hypothetical protein [Asticcacaulis excentricus]BBF81702.1 hypothetical protein EM6_2304 [Asticcacaulis excentricus]
MRLKPLTLSGLILATLVVTPLSVWAADDEIVATNRPKVALDTPAPAASVTPVTAEDTAKATQAQVLSTLDGTRTPDRRQPTSWGRDDTDSGPQKRQIHGEAGVSIGTGGYKSAYVATLIPVGETGTLGIAYSQTDHGNNGYIYGDPYGYGYGPGYGHYGASAYDPYGYGYGRGYGYARGGTSKSLSISLDFSDRGKDRDRDEDCDSVRYEGAIGDPIWGGYRPSRRVCTKTTNYPY